MAQLAFRQEQTRGLRRHRVPGQCAWLSDMSMDYERSSHVVWGTNLCEHQFVHRGSAGGHLCQATQAHP